MIFAYPELSKNDFLFFRVPISGMGLGNMLFPWARMIVASATRPDLNVMWPTWPQIRFGPIIRREKDIRFYFDLFTNNKSYVSGFRKAHILATHKKVTENEFLKLGSDLDLKNSVIIFSGLGNYFEVLNGWNEVLNEKLREMVNEKYLRRVDKISEIQLAIHIRMGDLGPNHCPLDWYVDTLKCIRSHFNSTIPAHVFSDGSPEQLSLMLREKKVTFCDAGNSIIDLLTMSKAKMIIGSASSFSAWASFLGKVPIVTKQGHELSWFNYYPDKTFFMDVFDPVNPSKNILDKICAINF